ncbi:hypothetical protein HELRODRAFT_175172 [Helobdella robusta]|uniref:Ras-associating domain-containing protein n=1 Tax=Helobdella robusta TaxID=6412 RepID=T1F8Y7_HELRO|nr:hypothetical protein HELRODRAFT_175172 [Helobdella robusta]ESO01142.1 hypothetical protein HELRODRAFT_175172 [Helobdella robusta]
MASYFHYEDDSDSPTEEEEDGYSLAEIRADQFEIDFEETLALFDALLINDDSFSDSFSLFSSSPPLTYSTAKPRSSHTSSDDKPLKFKSHNLSYKAALNDFIEDRPKSFLHDEVSEFNKVLTELATNSPKYQTLSSTASYHILAENDKFVHNHSHMGNRKSRDLNSSDYISLAPFENVTTKNDHKNENYFNLLRKHNVSSNSKHIKSGNINNNSTNNNNQVIHQSINCSENDDDCSSCSNSMSGFNKKESGHFRGIPVRSQSLDILGHICPKCLNAKRSSCREILKSGYFESISSMQFLNDVNDFDSNNCYSSNNNNCCNDNSGNNNNNYNNVTNRCLRCEPINSNANFKKYLKKCTQYDDEDDDGGICTGAIAAAADDAVRGDGGDRLDGDYDCGTLKKNDDDGVGGGKNKDGSDSAYQTGDSETMTSSMTSLVARMDKNKNNMAGLNYSSLASSISRLDLEQKLRVFNCNKLGLQMELSELDPSSFIGSIIINLNLTQPINMKLMTTSTVDRCDNFSDNNVNNTIKNTSTKNKSPNDQAGSKFRSLPHKFDSESSICSFHLPVGISKVVHITSESTVPIVIQSLLNKFNIIDDAKKFALFQKTHDSCQHDGSDSGGYNSYPSTAQTPTTTTTSTTTATCHMRKLLDHELPLEICLKWVLDGGLDALHRSQFVLQEYSTGEIIWNAFSLPELNNFLAILNREEENKIESICCYKRFLFFKLTSS